MSSKAEVSSSSQLEFSGIEFCGQMKADFAYCRVEVRRMANERYAAACICDHDRYRSGSVMIWGGICRNGRTVTVICNGNPISTSKATCLIIIPIVIPTVHKLDLFLQQDNARAHVACIVTETLD